MNDPRGFGPATQAMEAHMWGSDKELRESSYPDKDAQCGTCGRVLAEHHMGGGPVFRGFYGQQFCSRRCGGEFVQRMHRSQDAHARGGFR